MTRLYVAIPADPESRTNGTCAGCDAKLSRPGPAALADIVVHLTDGGEAVFLCTGCGESLRDAEAIFTPEVVAALTDTEYEIRTYE